MLGRAQFHTTFDEEENMVSKNSKRNIWLDRDEVVLLVCPAVSKSSIRYVCLERSISVSTIFPKSIEIKKFTLYFPR